MLTSALSLLFLLAVLTVCIASAVAWAVTLLQMSSVPDGAWTSAQADRQRWTLALLVGGPVAALVFWLTTWPQLSAAAPEAPGPEPAAPGSTGDGTTPRKAPARRTAARD